MTVEERFASVCRRLLDEDPRVEQDRIFHSIGVKIGGKFFAFARRGELVVKLPTARVQELVGSGEGRPFESGGRVMREWVCVRPADASSCAAHVREARDFVAAQTGASGSAGE